MNLFNGGYKMPPDLPTDIVLCKSGEFICRVCAVENNVERNKKRWRVSVCPVCGETHALFEVLTTKTVVV